MLNKVILIGHLGDDVEDRIGKAPCRFSLATTERWTESDTGKKRERTDWHQVVIFHAGLIDVAEKYLRKGSKVYVEGRLGTRSYEGRDGVKRYVTEIVLDGFKSKLVLLDRSEGGRAPAASSADEYGDVADDIYA
jgi:single-strand DNA-binding protein